MVKATLKSILRDALRSRGRLERDDIFRIAERSGFLQSTAERCFRKRRKSDKHNAIPCKKLNSSGKPARGTDFVKTYIWNGGKTFLKKYDKELRGKDK